MELHIYDKPTFCSLVAFVFPEKTMNHSNSTLHTYFHRHFRRHDVVFTALMDVLNIVIHTTSLFYRYGVSFSFPFSNEKGNALRTYRHSNLIWSILLVKCISYFEDRSTSRYIVNLEILAFFKGYVKKFHRLYDMITF